VSLVFFYVIYQVDGQTPSWYWPLVMGFTVSVCAEFLQGGYIDAKIAAGEVVDSSLSTLIKLSVLGLLGEFILLLGFYYL
jgi:hypothetical protein